MMWPKEYIELKRIEDLLLCGICYEFMDTSVMTSCSHSYCSLCIRKYLHYKTQCPACLVETFEKDLRKNKVLDEIIVQFSQIKDKLKRTLKIQIQIEKFNETNDVYETSKLSQSKDVKVNEENKLVGNRIISNIPTSENNTSPSTSVQTDLSSPSTSGRPKIPLMFTPKHNKRPIVTDVEEKKVVCPVCNVNVSELYVNRHLDDCLKRESGTTKPQIVESQRKPLPKLVLSLMKENVMRKKLKEFGLSPQGDRKALEARLQRYIVLYNAECDKSNPRSVLELIKQCEDEENQEKQINKTFFQNKLQVTRNSEQNVIEDERKKYLEAHKDSFENLIKKIKSTDYKKKSSVRHSLLKENIDSNEDGPFKCQAVAKILDDSMIDTEQNDLQSLNSPVYIQDSDSDTSCPLQTYSSSDPTKFLKVKLSSNSSELQNKSETSDEESSNQFMLSNYSFVNMNKKEKYDSSDAYSDTSIYDKATQSAMENSFFKETPNNDSKNLPNTSPCKKLLQRKRKSSLEDEMKSMHSVTTNMKDLDSDQEKKEDESFLQDISHDVSSNDSTESVQNYGKLRSTNHRVLKSSVNDFSNLGKENISSSPECSGNRSLRKRSRDSMQTDNKLLLSRKKKLKKSSHYFIETKELNKDSSNTLNDKEVECLQSKPRLRKRHPNIAEDTAALRKSTRVKLKNNNS